MLTKIEHGNGITELQLAHPPANALNPALVQALRQAITSAARGGTRALILSGAEGMFSAGLDVPELLKLDAAAMSAFWREFIGLLRTIALSPVPIAAALTGHSPAGGAVLAIFCDTRIAAQGEFKIGLNEVQVGLPVPAVIYAAMQRLIGARQAERLCLHGLLITPDEALRIGLVDQVLPMERVIAAALEWCRSLLALPPQAVAATRQLARADLVESCTKLGERSHEDLMNVWFSAETQAAMRAMVARLAARKTSS
ncbi:MAG TPA: enoyl-CoA hydratase/isomerase family protein [Gammaproteobacteria bacterium]|nr:enoyl-CoA hydratase/isomerase family protein [Gammaproteobacteria bacterium]